MRLPLCLLAISISAIAHAADKPIVDFTPLERRFQADIRPVLKSHCLACHATDKPEGELDLEQFAALGDVRKHPRVWIKVVEMLDLGEMPPKDADQLSPGQQKSLRQWIDDYLKAEARANAGDPGPVPLRRLNNAEYTYTIRDLTGAHLHPAREFPVDGAGGEGFTNAAGALAMSPALFTKYLDAAKEISQHAVLLPDGFRFSNSSTPSDWTNEILAEIRELYGRYSDAQGATRVNLQGIVFDTNGGGRLPIEKYLAATVEERQALADGSKSLEEVATQRGLSPKYLATLWKLLTSETPSPLIAPLRAQWQTASPDQAGALGAQIAVWQNALTRFQNVGHMKPWMVPTSPVVAQQEVRVKLPAPADGGDVTIYLVAGSAGDGPKDDTVLWQRPRLVTPGQNDLPLRDVRQFAALMAQRRKAILQHTAKSLAAAAEADRSGRQASQDALAQKFGVTKDALQPWLHALGVSAHAGMTLNPLTQKQSKLAGYDFVNGWSQGDLPSVIANSSDQAVRIPGNMKAHGVTVHPTPTASVAVSWQSSLDGRVKIAAAVTHAHPECGNGVTWALELRRGLLRQLLASGVSQGGKSIPIGPLDAQSVHIGDVVSLVIGPRDGNHSCDLTDVELTVQSLEPDGPTWSLTADVSPDIHAGNPHADRRGQTGVWHFSQEPIAGPGATLLVPTESLLAKWLAEADAGKRDELAKRLQELLLSPAPADANSPDAQLRRGLVSYSGPLFVGQRNQKFTPADQPLAGDFGIDPQQFGVDPAGKKIDDADLAVAAASLVEIRLPADIAAGTEFVTNGLLLPGAGPDGSVQVFATLEKPADLETLRSDLPVITAENSAARQRFTAAFDEFRRMFPAALCYPKIVPVDEVITLTLFHREDEALMRLMLSDAERLRLDRLWDELRFVSRDAFTSVDAFAQLLEYASQDGDPKLFEPLRKPIDERAEQFRQQLLAAEPRHLDQVLQLAGQAYRRPLTDAEAAELRALYRTLRSEELPHDDAIRFLLARVLVSPRFLYREEVPGEGTEPTLLSDWELATRLSYFLWSSQPDEQLRQLAAEGKLRDPDVLANQARVMLNHPRYLRRLATEFGCQYLHVYDFDSLDEKSETHFPEFAALRGDMHEEAIRFLADIFRDDSSILGLLDANYTFINEPLAKFYGVEATGPEWRRIDGWKNRGRGGVLGLAATLAKQSGASRTSPILRGNWVSEVLLGEKLPKPPKGVPPLPDDEATEPLTVRQLTERHVRDERCSNCHRRIDPLGFSLERFDAIGRLRDKDLGGRPIDTKTTLMDGTELDGLEGLRTYLKDTRRDAFVRQFCRKLLGYALGRGVQLSDEPLLDEMLAALTKDDYLFGTAVAHIVRSPQFRTSRGRDFVSTEE